MIPVQVLDALGEWAAGDWIGGFLYPYLALLGVQFFSAIILLLIGLALYVKTSSIYTVVVIMLLGSTTMLALLPPEAHGLAYFIIAVSVAAIFYRLFKGRG